jgi:nitrogen regulatory protein P-II 1
MKKIEMIIRPEKLDLVRAALEEKGYSSMTVSDVEGRGKQKGISLEWRVGEYRVEFLPKIKVEVVVDDTACDGVIDTVCDAAKTGAVGDGKIFVSSIDKVVRIRTGECDGEAT